MRALAADTFILTHEAPETRGTWEGHGVLGYYLGPHLPITALIYHDVFVTATSAPPVTDTVAWFPETDVTPPPPNSTEMLIAAIKDFFRAIKNFNLTGNFNPPTLVQDIEALASLHNGSAEHRILSTTDATPTASVPAPPMEPRVVQQPVINQPSVQEIRVVETPHAVKEPRVVFPTLAIANPR